LLLFFFPVTVVRVSATTYRWMMLLQQSVEQIRLKDYVRQGNLEGQATP
jgi:hypothetical protein